MTPVLLLMAATLAQGTERVEVEPVTCWWRTGATAVRVGEPFDVLLTCSLLQTEAARAVADESRLDPGVVQLQPFEVVSGSRADDVSTEGRRFVQYDYRLRAVGENVFASEVALPPLEIPYRVESRVASGSTESGRDRTYAMPPLTVRVLSLVPDTADDIREAPIATVAEIERLASRGTALRAAAGVAAAAGLMMLGLAIAAGLRRRRAARPPAPRTVPAAAVLRAVGRELAAVREQVRASGWSDDRVARTLAAARLVAAYATNHPVSQRPLPTASTAAASGEIVVRGHRTSVVAVSATVTSTSDDALQTVLARFTEARYGRTAVAEPPLDEALEAVIARADRVASSRHFTEKLWTRWRR